MKALDHDMNAEAILASLDILGVASALLTITFGASREPSDFVVDYGGRVVTNRSGRKWDIAGSNWANCRQP